MPKLNVSYTSVGKKNAWLDEPNQAKTKRKTRTGWTGLEPRIGRCVISFVYNALRRLRFTIQRVAKPIGTVEYLLIPSDSAEFGQYMGSRFCVHSNVFGPGKAFAQN